MTHEKAKTDYTAAVDNLIAKYERRAANEAARFVRAADVVADLRDLTGGGDDA